ncbi:hypothetical protein BDP67DRAFT_210943 [Colletotrichum lupini]|nr:hypothetical protein BDP67DRAFT_210943 [Colletotrichum lupini]
MDTSVRCHGHLLAFVLWVRCSLSIFPSLLMTNDPGYGTPRGPHGDNLGYFGGGGGNLPKMGVPRLRTINKYGGYRSYR